MPFHVYILYSEDHDKYYVGQTRDLKSRFIDHGSYYVQLKKIVDR